MASSDLPFRVIYLKSIFDQVISFHWLSIIHGKKKKKKILGINYKASPDLAFFMSFSGLFPSCCSLLNTMCCSMGLSLSPVDIWGWIIVGEQGLSCATVRCSAASWPLPTRCQWYSLLPAMTTKNNSRHC